MIQKSTMQVPCGPYSIINEMRADQIPPFAVIVYLVINYFSNWDLGQSHGLSMIDIAKHLSVYEKNGEKEKGRSRVANAVKWLIENGWLRKNHRKGKANTYTVIHHKCAPEDIPLDSDGRPKKCAVPRGEGSAWDRMFSGEITWKACLFHTVMKVSSDWTEGTVKFTIETARSWLRFSRQTICDLRNTLIKAGLLEEIGNRFRGFMAKILPLPYEERRRRREHQQTKGMRCDGKFYYSYNEWWRISMETGDFQRKTDGRWRYVSDRELEDVNLKIYRDFTILRAGILASLENRASSGKHKLE